MLTFNYHIRKEKSSDIEAIDRVTLAAFSTAAHASGTESLIIKALRINRQLTISLVAEEEGRLIGHVAVSPVTISTRDEGWYGLGPVSVLPGRQGAGVGTALISTALAKLKEMQAAGCVVLGDPAYYGRFGFKTDARLQYPHSPAKYFQVLAFGEVMPAGVVAFNDSFNARS